MSCSRIFKLLAVVSTFSAMTCFALFAVADAGSADKAIRGKPVLIGTFVDSPVSGLTYTVSDSNIRPAPSSDDLGAVLDALRRQRCRFYQGTTGKDGSFRYKAGETVTFSIGDLVLGASEGKELVSPLDLVEGAAGVTDPRVTNISVLLQTLDQDGSLNNGIQITREISKIVSKFAEAIDFDQTTADFAKDADVAALLAELNADPAIFNDTDPRPRALRSAAAASAHLTRTLSARVTVATTTGLLRGYQATPTTWQWLGVPYARPPIGKLRWRPPVSPKPWKGVREATEWGDQAAQNPAYQTFGEGGMSEDCLYLNVTAPKEASGLPVMVWFHGGGFVILTGNTKAFNNPTSLPTKGVVLVSVTHRLGPLGYLAHPLLTDESGYDGSGNYGQMDLIAALEWIQDNIAAFGGDPDNVTIFGESGGGGKVISLMSSPLATNLFHKAICQSGMAVSSIGILNVPTLAEAEAVGTSLFERLGVTTLGEARQKSWTEIIAAELAYYPGGDYKDAYGPNIDSHYATMNMEASIKAGLPSDVPLLAGANSGDMAGLIPGMVEQMPWRSDHNSAPQYVYKFSKVPAGWAARDVLSYHGGELVYVFNYPASLVVHYLLGLVIDPATGAKLEVGDLNGNGVTGTAGDTADVFASAGYGAGDAAAADMAMTIWTNFAKTGIPQTSTFTWPEYTTANDTYVEITSTLTEKTGLSAGW